MMQECLNGYVIGADRYNTVILVAEIARKLGQAILSIYRPGESEDIVAKDLWRLLVNSRNHLFTLAIGHRRCRYRRPKLAI